MKMVPTLYLANTLGFTAYGQKHLDKYIVPRLEKLGYDVIEPFTRNKLLLEECSGKELAFLIGQSNKDSIDKCDTLVAILDGTDIDSGVASEIGYAYARPGLIINGYRNNFRRAPDNEGICDINLQIQYFIENSCGKIYSDFNKLIKGLKSEGI